MELKSFDVLGSALELIEKKTTGTNKVGISHANSLIDAGKVSHPSSWNHPSASEENSYLDNHSIEEYAKWFLGIDSSVDPKNKGHYTYVYTSDFKTVDRQGLIAIRQRAGQNHETAIFEAAGKMLEKIDGK